jgi:AcrR family transcriptional regulator
MKTKEKILLTALEMFNETNTQAVTTNHIAKQMGISPGNLHYHYKNREEIIRLLYIQMRDSLILPTDDLPQSIQELVEHQKLIHEVSWNYRFFQRELLFLLSRDQELKELYIKDNIAHRERIILSYKNFIANGYLDIPYENILDYLADSVIMNIQFWNPLLVTLGRPSDKHSFEAAIQRTNELLRPFLTQKALKELAKLEF